MAVLEDVVLVADGGDVTAGRQKHTFVYGEFNVQLPEGVEQVETDGRLADGFVYRPEGEIAPFDVGFARADVTVDLEVQSTDLELVVDEAQRDAEGDVFFERDITPAGLGEFVPGVDFVVGDVVSVERWRVLLPLPVTGWEMVSSASDGVVADRVHVSGQLISDSAARVRRNADLRREVEADKRQLQRSVRSVRSYADSAVSQERTERVADVAQVREVLGGTRADEGDLLSQLAAVQAQIRGMVGDGETPPPPGLLNSYLWMNTRLWEAQREINRQQAEINAAQEARDADYQEQLGQIMAVMDEQAATIERLQAQSVSVSPMMILARGPDWMLDGYSWVALGDWTGSVRITAKDTSERVSVSSWSVPDSNGSRTYSIPGTFFVSGDYQKHPGTQTTRKLTWGYIRNTVAGQWRTLTTTTIGNTSEVFVDATAWLDAAHRGATYRLAIVIDGTTRKTFSSSSVGPLLPSGDGHVPIRVQGTFSAAKNSRVEVRYSCSFEGVGDVQQRRVRSGSVKLSWIEAAG